MSSVSLANIAAGREYPHIRHMAKSVQKRSSQKGGYHHGDLRESLVRATRELVIERGAENFTLADACRQAGVSTAAPYRHFRDKQQILEEIVASGFDELAARSAKAVTARGEGTIEGLIAMGRAYVQFAVDEPAIFRLMFGQNPSLKKADLVAAQGRACFGNVIGQVGLYCQRHGLESSAEMIAVELWTFVHGAASLLIDGDYEKVTPGIDIEAMLANITPRVLSKPPA